MADVEGILQKLKDLDISYDKHEHEPVMTCEAQVGPGPGGQGA